MADIKQNSKGELEGKVGVETSKEKEIQKKEAEKIKEKKRESGEEISAIVGGMEIPEISEFVEGKIAEKVGEDKKVGPTGGAAGTGSTTGFDLSKIEIPKVEVMREQIAIKINTEIKKLEKEAKRIKKSPQFSAFDFNLVVTKIRYLQDLLANIAHATVETLKGLWLKYVKGIST